MTEVITSTLTIVNPGINSAVNELLTNGLKAVTLLLVTGVTYGINYWIKSLKSSWQKAIAARAVAYAQQKITGNEEKRQVAAAKIHAKIPRISAQDIEDLLEEAVVNLKAGLKPPK